MYIFCSMAQVSSFQLMRVCNSNESVESKVKLPALLLIISTTARVRDFSVFEEGWMTL